MDDSTDIPPLSTAAAPLVGSLHAKTRSYIAFVWLGLGTLLPFNFFITAGPYFCHKFHDTNQTNSSIHLGLLYESTVIFCSSLTNLITVIFVTIKCVPYIYKKRIYISLSMIIVCFSASMAVVIVPSAHYGVLLFAITMLLVMIQSVCSAVLLNCFFSLASTLPARYIQGFGSGQALGGVLIAICSIISLSFSRSIHTGSIASYFLLAILVIISDMIVYFFLEKTHLFQIYSSAAQEINNEHEPFFHEGSSSDDDYRPLIVAPIAARERLFVIYKQIKWNFWGIFLTFVSTFSIFPASLSKIQSVYQDTYDSNRYWPDRLFVPVMTFLLFFLGETFGRMLTSKAHIPSLKYPRRLFFLCSTRFLFILLFAFCNFPITENYPHVFKHDAVYAILVFLFASSHGYCNSLNLMYAPRRAQTQLGGTVGALMMMALAAGTFVGSFLSYGVFILYRLNTLSIDQLCHA